MSKKILKRNRLARDLALALMIFIAAVLVIVRSLASQAKRDVSTQFIYNEADQALGRFSLMTGSVEATLGLVRDWAKSGVITVAGSSELGKLIFPLFTSEHLLNGISLADIESNSFHVRREGIGYRSSRIAAGRNERLSTVAYWDEHFEPLENYTTNSVYDPRSRPWFAPALASEQICWTEPYTFYESGSVGVSASVSYVREEDARQVVVAFDILLDDLFDGMCKLAPTEASRVFIFRRDAQLYVPRGEGRASDFLSVGQVSDELARTAHAHWQSEGYLSERVVSFVHDRVKWWGVFKPLDEGSETVWIAIMVPEGDIVGHTGSWLRQFGLMGLASLLVVGLTGVLLIRRYGRTDVIADFDEADPVGSIHRIIAAGENRHVEFKSTLRMNLHTKNPGKEIELAWLKGVAGFLNTDGGTLLLGVTDAGEITGLERDVFENEDKCQLHFKNLIATHIGAELSKYIRFQIIHVEGKQVGVVVCERSLEPVFLKNNQKEAFYIRNGPSSDELPVSKAFQYIKHRS